jgi:hypothetical protein
MKTQQYKDQNTTIQGTIHNNTRNKTQQYKDKKTTIQRTKHNNTKNKTQPIVVF